VTLTPTRLRLRRDGAIARLELHRPEVRNAFDDVMIAELIGVLRDLAADEAMRVLVISAAGDAFCAGADLHWMQKTRDFSYRENLDDALALADMLYRLYSFPHPTVARVHGAVVGGGNGIVAAADIAIAADDAFFGLSEVRLGLMPSVIGPYVVKKVGEGAARRLFLTGERFNAARARELGYISEVVLPGVERVVETLLQGGPVAQRFAKELLESLGELSLEEARSHTAELIARMRVGDEAQEGMAAFLEKRRPRWTRGPR